MSDGMAGFIAASMSPETPQLIAMEFKMTEAQQRAYDQAQVMLAFSQGKKIQAKHYSNHEWRDFMDSDSWNWNAMDYRIAPEPQEVWLWVKEGVQGGQVYDVGSGIKDKFMHGQGYTKKLFREVLDA